MTQKILKNTTMRLGNMPDLPSGRKIDFERIAVDENSTIVIVACAGYRDNDFTVYSGLPYPFKDPTYEGYFPQFHSPAGVASNGDKMSEVDAKLLFPEYKDWKYNR